MKAFQSRGGKLILYHGWSDAAISPLNSINYYESIQATMGKQQADSFLRLYMVPGMQHCAGGPGPDNFGQLGIPPVNDPQHNIYQALEQWTEKGTPPSGVIASKLEADAPPASVTPTSTPKVKLTRPLCAYPQQPKYKGNGNPNQAASFTCNNP
jgi:feruloyl esterase